jgi:hypothetical protein
MCLKSIFRCFRVESKIKKLKRKVELKMKTNMKKKKELNLKSEKHSKLITNIVEKALAGISIKEIIELRKVGAENRYEYYNRIKLKYIGMLGLLGINYEITEEVESRLFFLIHDIIQQITVEKYENVNEPLTVSFSQYH